MRSRPLLWAVAYVVATTLCFSPTLSFRDGPAAPGMVAPRDIVAPRDLIVPDPDATARRRAEVAAEVLPVYDFDAAAPRASSSSCASPSTRRARPSRARGRRGS